MTKVGSDTVIFLHDDDPKKPSSIINCHLIVRQGDPPLFRFNDEGLAEVCLTSYILVPKECVTPSELRRMCDRNMPKVVEN